MTVEKKVKPSIRKDKLLVRLNTMAEDISEKTDSRKIFSEVKTMLSARRYRKFDKSVFRGANDNVADWAGEVAGYQANLADIQIVLIDRQEDLKEAVDAVRKHLLHTYKDRFKGTSVSDRKGATDVYLREPMKVLATLNKLLRIVSVAEKELERSYFNSQLVRSLIEISNRTSYGKD